MEKLTDKQKKAFNYIRDQAMNHGCAPTLRELCTFMGYKAVGSAQDIVAALRKKGYLEVPEKQAARSLMLSETGKHYGGVQQIMLERDEASYTVPCLGSVPAGNPIEAIEEKIGHIKVSPSLFTPPRPQPQQLFALKASGLSMIDAGILDGDWLIVKTQQGARPGNIVVARIEGDATVKRLEKDKTSGWYLKPENENFPKIFAKDQPFEIIGKVIALQRVFGS